MTRSYMPDAARLRRPLRVTLDAEERASLEGIALLDRLPISRVIGRLASEEWARRCESGLRQRTETTKPRRR